MKNVIEFSDNELKVIFVDDHKKSQEVKHMYIETIKHARSELDNLKNILSDFTQRTASLLTFAGLIVLLP